MSSLSLRALFIVPFVLIICSFLCSSCEKELSSSDDAVHTSMIALYNESRSLIETSADSVANYYTKFAGFYNQHPECEQDELFPPTVRNLDNAFNHYGIVQIGSVIVKTQWEGDTTIYY